LVHLPDDDCLVVHDCIPPGWTHGQRIVLLVHGLGGSHQSGYMSRLATMLLPLGYRVLRMDLRGAGDGVALARRTYNAGCSEDVRAVANEVGRLAPNSPLVLVGMSLGGNIVLKLAGESVAEPVANLAGVAAVSPPIDLERCAALMGLRRNRFYERWFLHGLLKQVHSQWRCMPDVPRIQFPPHLTLRRFDELYTAPRGGFADALDYYRRSSAAPLVHRIEVPAFILTARDDPFIAVESFLELGSRSNVEAHVMDRGGHLGFVGADGAGGFRWAERRVVDWILRV
jgi:predicted alpha/beta-fold hydrolase